MGIIGRIRTLAIAAALIVGSPCADPARVAAQSPTNGWHLERAKPRGESDISPVTEMSRVSVASKDVAGAANGDLPLEIHITKNSDSIIESIRLIGIPPGTAVSDYKNTFTSFDENAEADVTAWDISKLHIKQNSRRENSFSFAVAVIWAPRPGGQIDMATSIVNVRFAADVSIGSIGEPGTPGKNPVRRAEGDLSTRSSSDPPPPVAKLPATSVIEVRRPEKTADIDQVAPPVSARPTLSGDDSRASPPRPSPTQAPADADRMTERAKALIRLGDISGARLLLERAQTRNAPEATFLLAQTWDPEMLQAWKVRGMRADPDLARRLYAKAAEQGQTGERLLTATRP